MRNRFKSLVFAVLLVCLISSTSFGFAPLIIPGLTLADALLGTTILAVVTSNAAYYVARTSNLTIADISPTIGFIQRYASVLWTDATVSASPVTKSAPITVNVPITKVKEIVKTAKQTYPVLYNKFYADPVVATPEGVPYTNTNNTPDVLFGGGYRWDFTGSETISTAYFTNTNSALTESQPACLATYVPVPAYISTNPASLTVISKCIHVQKAQNYASSGDLVYTNREYRVAITQEVPPVASTLPVSAAAEIDNIIIANPSIAFGYDGVNDPVTSADLVGSGAAVPVPLTGSDMTNSILDAFGLSSAVVPDANTATVNDELGNPIPPPTTYDASIVLPEKKSLTSLFGTLFTNSPLAGIVRGFTMSTTGQTAVVDCGVVYGKDFKFDFTRWTSFMTACGSVLMIIVHGFAIMIVMKGWKS